MNYTQTLEYMFSRLPMYQRIGGAAYKADLTNTLKLCQLLGNPERSFPSVHIAGTNGKGSVSHMLASVMQEAGIKTGLYTSPHLKDFRERIRINGKMIPEDRVIDFVEKYKNEFEHIGLSFFEMTVGLAFDYFRDEKIDIAIIEAGLGGRLDSTNIITPVVSVITNISFDHKQFLGDTLGKIAAEKAGIIKPGIPVVIGETHPETEIIFREKSRAEAAPVIFADKVLHIENSRLTDRGLLRKLSICEGDKILFEDLTLPLPGIYQEKNILTAITTLKHLYSRFNISDEIIRKGIENVIRNTSLMGRWQILSTTPLTICDTGHNEAGIAEVLKQISQTPHEKLHFVFGVVNDKEIDNILTMLPEDAEYYFCKADIPRGLDASILKEKAASEGLRGETYSSVAEAIHSARSAAGKNDLVFIGGSTFVVAEAL